jgi:3-oxoacyl-[acyl-carrier-protein] synthase-1
MQRSVHLVALGARTPVGFTAEASAAAVRAGISRVREHPFMIDAAGDPVRCGRDAGIDPRLLGAPRHQALASCALREVLDKLLHTRPSMTDLRLFLALPEYRPGFGAREARQVQDALATVGASAGVALSIEVSGQGHAGALEALERAYLRIQRGDCPVCLAGGVDSYLEGNTLDWLEADRRVSREGVRSGFHPGEAAAVLALASDDTRKQRGLPSLGRIISVACATETRDPHSGPGLLGEALTRVVQRVRGSAGVSGPIDDVYCDINGERLRTTDWGFTLLREGTWFRDGSQYVSPVQACGDLGAATASFNTVLAARAWSRNYAHGARALIWGASWKGLRGAMVLERFAGS